MDKPQRPAELSEEAWQATAPEARQFIALLVAKLAALEARLNQNSQNSSKPPSSDPPSAPPRPIKTPRGKPKPKGAQPGHPDQQRELVPTENVTRVVELHPTGCPWCQLPFPHAAAATQDTCSRPILQGCPVTLLDSVQPYLLIPP